MSLCGICGSKHVPADCDLIQVTSHIPDRIIPTRARLTMPESLELRNMADGTYDVAALYPFEKGTQFGPLVSKKLCSLLPAINFPLRVFCERGSEDQTFSEYYLDTTNEDECNWMMFVSAAADFREQNIICYQDGEDIYYLTVKDICEGEALKVWYSPYYAAKMQKETWKPSSNDENHNVTENSVVEQLVKNKKNISAREIWSCKFCGKTEKLLSEFALHLIQHYRIKADTFCRLCNFPFNREKAYQEHMKQVHKTNAVSLPIEQQSAVLQTSEENIPDSLSKNTSIGGPLMFSSLLGDSMDNTMLIFTKSDSNGIDQSRREGQNNNNLGVEVLSLNVESTPCDNVKVLDNFNFELASNGNEQLICDICLSDFNSFKELITHMNIHWKGPESMAYDKVSKNTNKAAHLRHTENNELLKQPSIIQKSIPSLPELQPKDAYFGDPFLLTGLPSENIDIDNTTLILDSNQIDLSGIQNQNGLFESENMNLNVEMILPENVKELDNFNFEIAPNENEQPVCDICLKTFKNSKALILHMNVHAGKFVCFECNKKKMTKKYDPNNPKDADELLKIYESLEDDDTLAKEIDQCDEVQLTLYYPNDGNDSDRDDAGSDEEDQFNYTFQSIGRGTLSQSMDITAVSRKNTAIEKTVMSNTTVAKTHESGKKRKREVAEISQSSENRKKSMKRIDRKWEEKELEKGAINDVFKNNIEPHILNEWRQQNLKPIDVFKLFFDKKCMDYLCKETVKYASQKSCPFSLSVDDLYKYFGILILSGYHPLPSRRMYWECRGDSHSHLVSNTMSRNRFEQFHRFLHFNDNTLYQQTNKAFKVQPLIDHLNERFHHYLQPVNGSFSVDEAMEPYYEHHSMKQFIRGKPIRYGYKFWCVATSKG
ncbi:uncharacterized protein [Diabrotica undecimpunctata]|uniref:uncharacterized protein isoform X2 n=1 Tax=Diabrotica undecimpunctata TaxID=50387 RepID=UPI003B633174